jgi:hypothetical protein
MGIGTVEDDEATGLLPITVDDEAEGSFDKNKATNRYILVSSFFFSLKFIKHVRLLSGSLLSKECLCCLCCCVNELSMGS